MNRHTHIIKQVRGNGFQLTLSVSAFLVAILDMESPTFLTKRMNPAPLKADVSLALGSCGGSSMHGLVQQCISTYILPHSPENLSNLNLS